MSGVLQTDRATDDHFHTIPDMFVDPGSSFPEESRDPAHHFLPVSEHWLKRTFNTWSAPPIATPPNFPHPQERQWSPSSSGGSCLRSRYSIHPFPFPRFPIIPFHINRTNIEKDSKHNSEAVNAFSNTRSIN